MWKLKVETKLQKGLSEEGQGRRIWRVDDIETKVDVPDTETDTEMETIEAGE